MSGFLTEESASSLGLTEVQFVAINNLLAFIKFKTISELVEATDPLGGFIPIDKGNGELEKIPASVFYQLLANFAEPISPTDAAPVKKGWYKPQISSELDKPSDPNSPTDWGAKYPNLQNLRAKSGYDTLFYYDGFSAWKRTESKNPGNAPKVVFNTSDDVFSATMKATDTFMLANSKTYLQKVIDDSIGSNQTEVIAYGKGTAYNTPANSGVWIGNRLPHLAGTLKSITFNALKTEKYQFVIVTINSNTQKLTFTNTYFDYTPTQVGVVTFNVPAGITITADQSVFLSLNTTGKLGYTLDGAMTDCEFCETAGGSDVVYTPHAGFVPIVMNVEVPKGRIPFTVDQWTLKTWEDLNGGNENLDFTSVVNLDKSKSIKYTKLTSLASFTKGSTLIIDKLCTYKLTGGSVAFSSDFLALENSKPYDPTKTNVIKFFKEYGKIRYTNEVLPLEPI